MDINSMIGANIRAMRKRKGLKLSQFADLLACYGMCKPSQSLLSAWERGQRSISAQNLWYVANALECTTDFLMQAPEAAAQPSRLSLQLRRMSTNEQAIVHYGAAQWRGDVHALLRANGMYMQMPASYRCDVVAILATMWDICRRQGLLIDVPYNVSVQDIRDKFEQMIVKR